MSYRRAVRRVLGAIAVVAVATLTASGCDLHRTAAPRPAGEAVVEKIVDGDTLDVDLSGKTERVRLLGIDTPETVDENRPVQCYGREASAYLSQLLPKGSVVRLERDTEARDRFGRLLVYLYRVDDGLFVNAALLEGGFATTLSIAPNTMRAHDFEVIRLQSQREKRGMWGVCAAFGSPIDPTPTTRG